MVCNSTDEPAPSILKADTSWHKRSKHRDWTKLFYEKAMWIYFLNFTSFEIMVVKEDLCKNLFWVIVWFNYLSTWSKVSLLSLRFICKPIFVFVWQAVIIWVFIKVRLCCENLILCVKGKLEIVKIDIQTLLIYSSIFVSPLYEIWLPLSLTSCDTIKR